MNTYIDSWISVATALFAQALAGEPQLAESLPKPMGAGARSFVTTLTGDEAGNFSVVLDATIFEAPLMGDGADQKAGWAELLREVADAAAGELLAKTSKKCRVEEFKETGAPSQISRAFQLKSSSGTWTIAVRDEVRAVQSSEARPNEARPKDAPAVTESASPSPVSPPPPVSSATGISPAIELLLDVELEAALRFGCREMPLGEILDLGPGDVVELDRHIADPVDLIVGDKIVARGEVVLVNGNFGLRITEVATPRMRLESIRCLF